MTEDELEAVGAVLTERQIKLLGSYVRTTLYTRPSDADENDYAALLDHNLIEPVAGVGYKVSFSGSHAAEQTADAHHATAEGRAWFDWYDEQSKRRN